MAIRNLKLAALREWERLEARIAAPGGRPQWRPLARRALVLAGKLSVLAVLPFFVLVRGSVFLYAHRGYGPWLALAGGAGCTLVVVTAYAAWLSHRLTGRVNVLVLARRVALPLVLAYCGYALIYLSSGNAKSDQVRAYYSSLHPLLRVALSTWILVDRDIVITDAARRRADYATMGMRPNDGSLHYVQDDGYVHAVDLRTRGRSELKNRLVQLYFWTVGLGTLRHVGTSDHLHVELRLR
jgi:hypothetical protein